LNVLLVAEESAGVRVLRLLAEGGHMIVGVLTTPPAGTGAVATVAEEV
jgi:methionyl-tRNA formyltransferase